MNPYDDEFGGMVIDMNPGRKLEAAARQRRIEENQARFLAECEDARPDPRVTGLAEEIVRATSLEVAWDPGWTQRFRELDRPQRVACWAQLSAHWLRNPPTPLAWQRRIHREFAMLVVECFNVKKG